MPCSDTAREKHLVVVVEDEFLIREAACDALTEAGFDVVSVEHAEAALDVLHRRAAEIRGMFTDIHMTGETDGLQLAHIARRKWPWIVLLIASGQARPRPHELPEGSRFVQKPYDPDHVIDHLRDMIAA